MNGGDKDGVRFVSPFAINQQGSWRFAAKLGAVPEGGVLALARREQSLGTPVAQRRGGGVLRECVRTSRHGAGHGFVSDGIVTCPHHGFQYDLRSGECLTAPEVALQSHAVRVVGDRVEVRLSS